MQCRLKQVMEKTGKNVKELSKETGISIQTIEKYCNNEIYYVYFKTLNKLCMALNCDTTDLFSSHSES